MYANAVLYINLFMSWSKFMQYIKNLEMFCKGNPLPPLLVFDFFKNLTGINNNNELHIHVPLNYKVILIYTLNVLFLSCSLSKLRLCCVHDKKKCLY